MNLTRFLDEDNITVDRSTRKLRRSFTAKHFFPSMAALIAFLAVGMPLFGSISLYVAPFVVLFTIWAINAVLNFEIRRVNSSVEPPHKLIKGFEEWEEGDRVDLYVFDDKLRYKGVTDNHDLIFRWNHFKNNGKVFPLPPLFVKKALKQNPDARKRMISGFDHRLRREIEESEYQKFLDHLSEEKENLKNEQEQLPEADVC